MNPARSGHPAPPLLDIRNATVWRGHTRVFRDLSLRIDQHQNVAILGPNGAGKTTLLRLLTRELYPVRAPGSSVRLMGRETWNVWELRRELGIVSHDLQTGYAPGVRGTDIVLSGFSTSIGLHGVAYPFSLAEREAAKEAMDRLDISHLAGKPYSRMSTGQQRRFLLARALVSLPRALVLDEPCAGLDITAAFACQRTLHTLMANGVSVVLVTHHVNEIPPGIKRVILLRDGTIVADGSKHEVLSSRQMTALYDTPVRILEADGYFFALPEDTSGPSKVPELPEGNNHIRGSG